MHAARIEPGKERLLVPIRAVDEVEGGFKKLLVDRLHALLGERSGIGAALLAPLAETRILAWRLGDGRRAAQHAARTEAQPELGALRVVRVLGLVLRVQVVEIAEELVEAVNGRQEFVAVAEMVLAELPGRVALRLEQFGERRVLLRQPFFRPGSPTFSRPVRIGLCPVMKTARPAVQDCWP